MLMTLRQSKRRRLGPRETCDLEIKETSAPVLHLSLKEQEVHSHRLYTYLTAINNWTKSFLPLSVFGLFVSMHPNTRKNILKQTEFWFQCLILIFIYAFCLFLLLFLLQASACNFLKCNIKFYVFFVFYVLSKSVFSVSAVIVFLLLCNRIKALWIPLSHLQEDEEPVAQIVKRGPLPSSGGVEEAQAVLVSPPLHVDFELQAYSPPKSQQVRS